MQPFVPWIHNKSTQAIRKKKTKTKREGEREMEKQASMRVKEKGEKDFIPSSRSCALWIAITSLRGGSWQGRE